MHNDLRQVAVAPAFQPQGATTLHCPFSSVSMPSAFTCRLLWMRAQPLARRPDCQAPPIRAPLQVFYRAHAAVKHLAELVLRSHADFLKLHNEEAAKGKQHIVDNLSTYGYQNTAEFIAEAWSEYLNNETPRPIAVAVGTLIKKLYADTFQAPSSSSSP